MKNILVFGASSSKNSINAKFATFAANQLENVSIKSIDLNDFEMPIYSFDKESENGIPELAKQFVNEIENADAIIISFAEHNGSYSSAFKNIMDWGSRATKKLWAEKPMLLLATSPGARGGATVLESAKNYFPYMGANVVSSFSFPSFYENFSEGEITNPELKQTFLDQLEKLKNAL